MQGRHQSHKHLEGNSSIKIKASLSIESKSVGCCIFNVDQSLKIKIKEREKFEKFPVFCTHLDCDVGRNFHERVALLQLNCLCLAFLSDRMPQTLRASE